MSSDFCSKPLPLWLLLKPLSSLSTKTKILKLKSQQENQKHWKNCSFFFFFFFLNLPLVKSTDIELTNTEDRLYFFVCSLFQLKCSWNIALYFILFLFYLFGGFPGGSNSKESACSAGDPCSIPGLGRSRGEGHGNPLQCSFLENPMDRGAWQVMVYWVAKSRTWLKRLSMHVSVWSNCILVEWWTVR